MIRLGVVLDSEEIPSWQCYLIQLLIASGSCGDPVLVIAGAKSNGDDWIATSRLYRLFRRFDYFRGGIAPDSCQRRALDAALLERLKVVRWPAPDDLEFDIILVLGGLSRIDEFRERAGSGVWYFDHGSGPSGGIGAAVGFREVIGRKPHVWSALMWLRPGRDKACVAYESWSAVNPNSHVETRNKVLWKSAQFVTRALQRLGAAEGHPEKPATGRTRHLRSAGMLFPLLSYLGWRLVQKRLRRRTLEKWALLWCPRETAHDTRQFRLIESPPDRFWADPQLVNRDGRHYLFFEDASTETGHGRVSVMSISANGDHAEPATVLDEDYHLSYPHVFRWRDDHYLVPESAETRRISVYRFRQFPHEVEFVHNLMEDIEAYDSTLFPHDGRWWLFANVRSHEGASDWDELCIFHSDSPLSQSWQPHALNPVISDVRRARPAGPIYTEDGALLRPSQDSSHRYGYGLNINRIVELTPDSYREETVRQIRPDWHRSICAVHSWTLSDQLVVIDAIHRKRIG